VLAEIDSTGEPGICSAVKYSAAIKGTVNPTILSIRLDRNSRHALGDLR
jgi:hypothetical protein